MRAQADAAGWKAGFYPEKGTEYKEVSGLAGGASREEREELVVAADRCASGLTAQCGRPPSGPARRAQGSGDGVWGGQLEVSEWTLPGPSVGDVTDEGVVASCQPPLALMPWGLYI